MKESFVVPRRAPRPHAWMANAKPMLETTAWSQLVGAAIAAILRNGLARLAPEHPAGKRRSPQPRVLLASVMLSPVVAGSVDAALLDLPERPLEFAAPVQPNVFFMLDDSGTADWSLMTPEDTGAMALTALQPSFDAGGIGCTYFYAHPHPGRGTDISPGANIFSVGGSPDVDYRTMPSQEAMAMLSTTLNDPQWVNAGAWRAWNKDYNALYYDSAQTYAPWAGKDISGVVYGAAPPTAAPYNPFNPAHGALNLRQAFDYTAAISCSLANQPRFTYTSQGFYAARYYKWDDTNTDGIVDATDGFTLVEIRPASEGGSDSYERPDSRTDCSSPSGGTVTCSFDQEIQNFANWFSYHRKRDLAIKSAVSAVIQSSTARIGLATLHNNQNIGTAVRDVDDISQPVDASAENAKDALLRNLSQVRATGGTPLRQALERAGTYYQSAAPIGLGFSDPSPIQPSSDGGTCQHNFTVVVADGAWNGSVPNVGNADNDGVPSAPPGPFDGASYGDNYSNTLADVAMHFYERDLSPALADQVPVTMVDAIPDTNTAQHMVTMAAALGVTGTLDADPPNRTDPFVWPLPAAGSATTVDDLRHAAWNGRGLFVEASSGAQLTSGLQTMMRHIVERAGGAPDGVGSTSVRVDGYLFQASFDATRWSGDLQAFMVGTGSEPSLVWRAASALDAYPGGADARVVLTYNRDSNVAVPFRWDQLSEPQKDDLRTNGDGTTAGEPLAQARLAYLRGDRNCETDADNPLATNCEFDTDESGTIDDADEVLRPRTSRLGDIVHAWLAFVGAPPLSVYPDVAPFGATGDRYSMFAAAQAARPPVVYANANDGMAHAFLVEDVPALGATKGQELFAYVPSAVYSTLAGKGLHRLTEPDYPHRAYVDGTPSVDAAYIQGAWRTVLVSGLRDGGQGYFAIDVTDPAALAAEGSAASRILWEFLDRDTIAGAVTNGDPDLGYTHSKPVIGLVRTGTGSSAGDFTWVAIFGNGYNNSENDGSASTTGHALLFVVDLETGDLLKKIDTGIGEPGTPNGLNTPAAVDVDDDAIIDLVYAGDLRGNLWKFDLRGALAAWAVANSGVPLFQGVDSGNLPQPITTRPFVDTHPDGLSGRVVYFGTGQLLESNDTMSSAVQSFYAIWDRDLDGGGVTRGDLLNQPLSATIIPGSSDEALVTDNLPIAWRVDDDVSTLDYLGWHMDLTASGTIGERVVTDAVVDGDIVFFNSARPSNDACQAPGDSVLYSVARSNGGSPDFVVVDINNDAVFDFDDQLAVDGDLINVAGTLARSAPGKVNFLCCGKGCGRNAVQTGASTDAAAPDQGAVCGSNGRLTVREVAENTTTQPVAIPSLTAWGQLLLVLGLLVVALRALGCGPVARWPRRAS